MKMDNRPEFDCYRQGGDVASLGPTLADDLRTVFYAFATRWFLIACIVAVSVCIGIGYLWAAKPSYTSTMSILVDPRERHLTEGEVVPMGLGSSSLGADSALVESQVQILTSRSVLDRLIAEENLLEDPQFGGSSGNENPVKSLIRRALYGPNIDQFAPPSPYDATVEKLRKAISIGRVGNTYVLTVSVETYSAERSARLANRIGEIYLEQDQEAADASTLEAAIALEDRLGELLQTANEAHREVEEYRSRMGLLGTQGMLVDEQQLRNLNDGVTVASIESERAKARLDELRRLVDQPASRLVSSNILQSELTETLRSQLAAAVSAEESLRQTFGSRHPQLQRAIKNREVLEHALVAEFERIVGRAESDYQRAIAREQSLRDRLGELEGRQSELNAASIRLGELEQIAASSRAVYQTFLLRSKEAREQIDLPSVTARIISNAVPSSRPSDPQLRVVLAVSLFAGLLVAAGVAWLLHLLQDTTPRRPAADGTRRAGRATADWSTHPAAAHHTAIPGQARS